MKKIITTILIAFSSMLFANTASPIRNLISVQKQIETLLNTSLTPVYQDISVMVKFKLNERDEIIVTSIASNEYEITHFIRTSLNKKVLLIDPSSNARFYSIPIRFIVKDMKSL